MTKTIFLAKQSIFANHVIHIWKASPKTDGLRYFGTLFVHFMMRQIFGNTVQWDRYVNLILRCVLNHFFIPASLQYPTSKNYFNGKKNKTKKKSLSIQRINPLQRGIFYQRNTLYDLCGEIWGMMRRPASRPHLQYQAIKWGPARKRPGYYLWHNHDPPNIAESALLDYQKLGLKGSSQERNVQRKVPFWAPPKYHIFSKTQIQVQHLGFATHDKIV